MTAIGYTVPAALSVPAVVTIELAWLRTGLLRRRSYWLTMGIVFAFQIGADGWLTKLPSPIVRYNAGALTGLRVPFDIPVEDYLFGFSLITLTLLCWVRARNRVGET